MTATSKLVVCLMASILSTPALAAAPIQIDTAGSGTTSAQQAKPQRSVPEISVDATEYHFGEISQGEVVEHTFILRNHGNEVLKITDVEIGGQGLTINVNNSIEPRSSVDAVVKLDTRRYRRRTKASLKLSFDKPGIKPLVLTMGGVVIPPIDILPMPAAFLSRFVGEDTTRTLTIQNNEKNPLTITKLESRGSHFTTRLETESAGELYQLHISAPEDTKPGRYQEFLVVHTNNPEYPRIQLQVNILIKSDIFLSREDIDFGAISLAQLRNQPNVLALLSDTVLIKRKEGEMALTGVASDIAFLKLDRDPEDGRARNFQLNVGLVAEKLEKGAFSGAIKIRTDDPQHPEIAIPVRGQVVD